MISKEDFSDVNVVRSRITTPICDDEIYKKKVV